MSLTITASRIEGVDTNNQDYIVDLKKFSRIEHDDLMTATGNLEVVLKADGFAWNDTGNLNMIGGREISIPGYMVRLKDLHYGKTGLTRPVVDRWEQFIYITSTNGNNVRKFQGITGSLVETQLFNTVSLGNVRQGGASNGYEMMYIHFNSGLTPAVNFKKRRFDIDVGDVMHTESFASNSSNTGGMANNYFDIVVFGRGHDGTLSEMMRFQDRGTIKTLPITTHTNGGSNRGGAASYDGHEWYDMFANASFAERRIDCYTFDESTTTTRHASSFRIQQGQSFAPQGNSFNNDELVTGRNTEMEIWNMASKASKSVVGGAFGAGTSPTQTWRGDRDDSMLCFGSSTNIVRINVTAQTQATIGSLPAGASGPCVQGGY
jgi:hypothetical protein